MGAILIDIGSSTVKVYKYSNGKLDLILQRSLYFKEGFDPEGGISPENKKELFELLEAIKEENKNTPIRLYATGIFRKLAPKTKINFIDEVFLRTGLYFNIIDQDLENFYLEMALVGKCNLNEPLLLINIGGGSTELVVMYGK
jgi:exopolyphosphatase/pppGpp-phosphohydrolase